jgi:hypothetical protein
VLFRSLHFGAHVLGSFYWSWIQYTPRGIRVQGVFYELKRITIDLGGI